MRMIHDFHFGDGSLFVFANTMATEISGQFVATPANAMRILQRECMVGDTERARRLIKKVESQTLWESPVPELERTFDTPTTQYLVYHITRLGRIPSKHLIDAHFDRRRRIVGFTLFGGDVYPRAAIGVVYPTGESTLAILTSILDTIAVLRTVVVEDELLLMSCKKQLVQNGFPMVQPVEKQVHLWGQMATLVNLSTYLTDVGC